MDTKSLSKNDIKEKKKTKHDSCNPVNSNPVI